MFISSDALNQSNPDAVIDTHANAMGCSGVANGGSVVQKMVYCMPVKLHITSRRNNYEENSNDYNRNLYSAGNVHRNCCSRLETQRTVIL